MEVVTMMEKVLIWFLDTETPQCEGWLNRDQCWLVCPFGLFRFPDFNFTIQGVCLNLRMFDMVVGGGRWEDIFVEEAVRKLALF